MKFNITLLPGDGIGPEVIDAAATVLNAVERRYGHDFGLHTRLIGGSAVDATGVPLPPETLNDCFNSDAVLLGAVGGERWDGLKPHLRPERGLLSLRQELGLFATVYPSVLHNELVQVCPLRTDVAKKGIDVMLVRETSRGIYFGERGYRDGEQGQEAFDTEVYSISDVERIAKIAFELAASRNKKVTSVDKANVLESSRLWRATVERVAVGYPDVKLEHMLIDVCASKLITSPSDFDVILTSNLLGNLLSGELASITASRGCLPSSSIGTRGIGVYSPSHGSANDIAGKDEANPMAAILASAMLLGQSLKLNAEAFAIENAVYKTLARGYRTKDIAGNRRAVSCSRFTEEIILNIFD